MNVCRQIAGVIILLISILTISCSSDFEPHILSGSTPVVYGVINPQDSLYQVQLTKSFIGPGNAYDYALISDSLYYEDAHVFLESRNFKGVTIEEVELQQIEIDPGDQGIFAPSPNIVYQTDCNSIRLRQTDLAELGIPYEIDLFLRVEIPGYPDFIESYSRLKLPPKILNPRGNFQKVYFFGQEPFRMEWSHSTPETYFEIQVVLHYKEVLEDGEREAIADWNLTGIELNEINFPGGSRTIYSYYFRPEVFYSQIRAAIPMDPEVKGRAIRYVDFIILTSDGAVKEYNEIGKISDDYNGANFTNIQNGLGLFASYNTFGVYKLSLGQRELDSLANGSYTKHLRFNKWE
jgi:hypothetical protein